MARRSFITLAGSQAGEAQAESGRRLTSGATVANSSSADKTTASRAAEMVTLAKPGRNSTHWACRRSAR